MCRDATRNVSEKPQRIPQDNDLALLTGIFFLFSLLSFWVFIILFISFFFLLSSAFWH